MKNRITLHASIIVSIIATTVAGSHVYASDATINPADSLEEITVTAERRETSLQRTPAAISTVGGDALSERRIQDIIDLSNSLPNVSSHALGARPQARVGNGADRNSGKMANDGYGGGIWRA